MKSLSEKIQDFEPDIFIKKYLKEKYGDTFKIFFFSMDVENIDDFNKVNMNTNSGFFINFFYLIEKEEIWIPMKYVKITEKEI